MSQMPLWMGDEGEQTEGLSQVQNPAGYEEDEEGLNSRFWPYYRYQTLRWSFAFRSAKSRARPAA
jgi:hypothetical protein